LLDVHVIVIVSASLEGKQREAVVPGQELGVWGKSTGSTFAEAN
jgi:hypothetical protein